MRIGAQKCFLREVLGFLPVPSEIERNPIGPLFVPLHKLLESLVIPASSQGHEIFISGLHSWTPTHQA
jgi:predicted N-formylglutamate amidohydrolase